jgi:hypothetical protein
VEKEKCFLAGRWGKGCDDDMTTMMMMMMLMMVMSGLATL